MQLRSQSLQSLSYTDKVGESWARVHSSPSSLEAMVSGLFITTALSYTGGLQGAGDTKSPLYISIISQVIVPLSICFVIRETSTLVPLHIWLAVLMGHVTRCILSVVRFNQGKWRSIKVNIDRQPA